MPQSLARVLLHLVFSTKNRERWLDAPLRPALYGYMAAVGRDLGCEVFRIGGVDDHVHLAIDLGRTVSVSEFVKKVKQTSSVWLKEQSRPHAAFEWQRGYGSFSIGQSQLARLIEYIDGQEDHHRKIGFADEYRALLRKYKMQGDERFMWD
ncbi:IS200/IS605 family transposase [Luteolibacter sp. LG18]|uniref:IS200/IS605 family transposase n=1 Tax=Luteolibacter sp. LG18 TaxID=2819286 RepID=UPI002B2F12AE|nr:hypothetical protein llg_12490 [Luteolibacter sp. LG18]